MPPGLNRDGWRSPDRPSAWAQRRTRPGRPRTNPRGPAISACPADNCQHRSRDFYQSVFGAKLCWSATRIRQAAATRRAHAGVHCRLRTGWLARTWPERRCRGCGQRLVFGVGQQLVGLAGDLPAGLAHEGAEAPDLRAQPFVVPAQAVVVCLEV